MGEATGYEVVDECLAGMGHASGVRGVVRRYHEHVEALRELGLRWRPDPAQSASLVAEIAVHPGGQFILEIGGTGIGRLVHLWPGWGRRTIGTGSPETLRLEALRILQAGGPFGGPTIARAGERIVQLSGLHGGVRRPLPDGSELRSVLLEQTTLGVRVWPDGKFAQASMTGAPEAQDVHSKMIEDDAEQLMIGSTSTPWVFTDLHPLLGAIRADPYALLLCPLRADLVALIAVRDHRYEFAVASWGDIRAMDAMPWLESFAARLSKDKAQAPAGADPMREEAAKESGKTAATPPSGGQAPSQGATSSDSSAGKRRKRVATSPGAMPGPRERRIRIKPALAAAVTQHLASVASGLPAGVLGAGFAVELLRALEAAALSDQPTLTGKTIELFSRLHKKGFLKSIPADQAGRAALKLLADRTPLVRRLHYRRWCFAFGDMHEPTSELYRRLTA